MELGSIFLILALLVPTILFIASPLLDRSKSPVSSTDQDLSALLARRDQVISTIQELDEDYTLGKIPADNYPQQRSALLFSGADILRQIDTLQVSTSQVPAEDRMEEAIQRQQLVPETTPTVVKRNGNAVPPVPDDELEQKIASRRRELSEKAAGFCPKCGRPVHASDRFCPKCGAALV